MPRKPRLDLEGALHHVMVRGIERSKLFRTRKDYQDLIRRFEDAFTGGKTVVYAWALMPNHVHLLIRTGVEPLSGVMRRILMVTLFLSTVGTSAQATFSRTDSSQF